MSLKSGFWKGKLTPKYLVFNQHTIQTSYENFIKFCGHVLAKTTTNCIDFVHVRIRLISNAAIKISNAIFLALTVFQTKIHYFSERLVMV